MPSRKVVLRPGREEPVYDLMNAGPRQRFTVRGPDGAPFIVHNCTQAVARDVLAEAIARLHAAGHEIVGHVHDEVIIEGTPSVEEITRIMVEPPAWSEGLPISAEGFHAPRYRKG